MARLEAEIDAIAAETEFSGVVRIDQGERTELAKAYGLAHRGYGIANEVDTRFATASATKSLTALTVVSLIEEGSLELSTHGSLGARLGPAAHRRRRDGRAPARAPVGHRRLPRRGGRLDLERLPAAGPGARARDDRAVPRRSRRVRAEVPARRALRLLQRRLRRARADRGAREPEHRSTSSCGSGCASPPAWTTPSSSAPTNCRLGRRSATSRSTAPGGANVFHLPVLGTGDGGIYTTAADVSAFWRALFAGRIVPADWVGEMVRPRSDVARGSMRYGLGFWLDASRDIVVMEGCDAGVSFRSDHHPGERRNAHRDLEHHRRRLADRPLVPGPLSRATGPRTGRPARRPDREAARSAGPRTRPRAPSRRRSRPRRPARRGRRPRSGCRTRRRARVRLPVSRCHSGRKLLITSSASSVRRSPLPKVASRCPSPGVSGRSAPRSGSELDRRRHVGDDPECVQLRHVQTLSRQ